jgi:hypothetical protein
MRRSAAARPAGLPPSAVRGALLTAAGVVAASLVAIGSPGASRAVAELPPAYELPALPAGLDSVTSLSDAARASGCANACSLVLYAWTPRMPLSRAGIAHVAGAAERAGTALALISYDELAEYAAAPRGSGAEVVPATDALLAAGALAHAPSLVVLREGRALGAAILGYKTPAAYESAIARRLTAVESGASTTAAARLDPAAAAEARPLRVADFPVVGVPGAYFRWVPGRNAVAYESGQRVYLLDLDDGQSRIAPGFIDFVPTPDGRYFVTPGEVDGGLTFYDADEVFDAVARGNPGEVEPIFTDLRMRDQYPSVGILEQDGAHTLYRVMTSWFEGVVYRDYDVRVDERTGASSVRPVGEVSQPCVGTALSTPIMSQDGREVAGRNEATGTTHVFRILEDGRCETLTDFGVQTSKVAWHASGRSVAFSIPRRRRGADEGEQGIFVLDREGRDLVRLPTSEAASRLAFPDFVGEDAVVFLVPGNGRERSVFRIVELAP